MEMDEEVIICPYNTCHVIAANRMPYHLIKCRKNYPLLELVVCPFNANHEVCKPELKHHMLNCPSKILLEREMTFEAMRESIIHADPPVKKGFTDLPRYRDHYVNNDDDENWEGEGWATHHDNPRFIPRTSRTTQHRRDNENSHLRRPITQSMAAITRSPAIEQFAESSPHTPFIFNAPIIGRGRAKLFLSLERDVSTTPGASGQSHVLQANNMLPLSVTRPGMSDIVWTAGRGRVSSLKYQ